MALEQREVFYSGRVQGVGFRYTALQIAGRFAVSGYVSNLHDGRVLLVAEGESAEVDAFLAGIAEAMGRYIRGVDTRTGAATGEFADFSVRR